ncbi:MAG: zinc-binding dehydrogenase [Anaerolineales bacterium]|nr:zinc-binding dehydrogenase [Anaerolineales bacterium]
MKAVVFTGVGEPLAYQEMPAPQPADHHIIVTLKAAALNHRDNWMTKGKYPGLRPNIIVGSDGAGTVGDRAVILNPSLNWGDSERFQAADYQILGMPSHGTLAEQIAVQPQQLVDKPAHLSFEQAAALPLAGLTAYRALFSRCQLQPGERVLISGVGGGVALFACQFAIAAGAEVFVTSSSAAKIEAAIALGAAGGANYREEGWHKKLGKETGGFDVVIDGAGGDGFAQLVALCRPGGRIGIYGGTRGMLSNISPQQLFFRQLSIHGSTMGSDKEFAEMVAFVNQHQLVPVVDAVFPLADVNEAIARMDRGEQFGKIVLRI